MWAHGGYCGVLLRPKPEGKGKDQNGWSKVRTYAAV